MPLGRIAIKTRSYHPLACSRPDTTSLRLPLVDSALHQAYASPAGWHYICQQHQKKRSAHAHSATLRLHGRCQGGRVMAHLMSFWQIPHSIAPRIAPRRMSLQISSAPILLSPVRESNRVYLVALAFCVHHLDEQTTESHSPGNWKAQHAEERTVKTWLSRCRITISSKKN